MKGICSYLRNCMCSLQSGPCSIWELYKWIDFKSTDWVNSSSETIRDQGTFHFGNSKGEVNPSSRQAEFAAVKPNLAGLSLFLFWLTSCLEKLAFIKANLCVWMSVCACVCELHEYIRKHMQTSVTHATYKCGSMYVCAFMYLGVCVDVWG